MEDNDEIYVMADANSPELTPIKPKRRISWITLGSLGAILTIFGVLLAYVLRANTSIKTGVNIQKPTESPLQKPEKSTIVSKPSQEKLTVNFSFNSVEIKPADISQIESLWFKAKNGKGKVTIAGYADQLGTEEYNQKLSQKRAENIAKILQKMGLDNRYQVVVKGFGEAKPVAENTTEQGRALNRRVEILFNIEK
jgi:outer membrane protein OmpA-like peptidoglycan-associated protein